MSDTKPMLHLLCGKIASGKSTLSAELSRNEDTIAIIEDAWLAALFSDEITSISSYVRCSAKLQSVMAPHIISLLQAGVSVVLDFPANTVSQRAWMREVIEQAGVDHQLHFLDVTDDICKARLHARNSVGDHPFAATDEQFELLAKHFVAPTPEEGFNIVRHGVDNA